MEILAYTEAHHVYRKRFRAYLEKEVMPHVDEWERNGIVPKSAWKSMGGNGFLCPCVKPEYGGMGGDFLHSVIINEEMTRTRHTGLIPGLHSDVVVPYIETFGTEEQKKKFLPGCVSGDYITAIGMTEPDNGSDLAGMKTTAVEKDGEVIINGSKIFISNGINCNLIVLSARNPEVENPYEAISLYIFETDTPGYKTGRKLDKMGMKSQDTAELFFTDCRIPVENRLSSKGAGFLLLMDKLQQERLVTAIGAQAASEVIAQWTIGYCKETKRGGKPLSKFQAIQFELVEIMTEIQLGRAFVDKLIKAHMAKESIIVETSMAKYWITEMLTRTVNRCMNIVGDFAATEACPLARAFRDVRVMSIYAGTNEIMKGIAAKFMGL